MSARRHVWLRNQRGSQALEFVALVPLVIFLVLVIWQFTLAAFTFIVAESAARDAAREAALARVGDPEAAARVAASGLPVRVEIARYQEGAREYVTATVGVQMPLARLPFAKDVRYYVTRRATMPAERR